MILCAAVFQWIYLIGYWAALQAISRDFHRNMRFFASDKNESLSRDALINHKKWNQVVEKTVINSLFKSRCIAVKSVLFFFHQQKKFNAFWSAGKTATAAHDFYFGVSQYIELTLTHIIPFIRRHNPIYAITVGRLVCRHSPHNQFSIFPWIRWEFIKFFNPFLNILFNYGKRERKIYFS